MGLDITAYSNLLLVDDCVGCSDVFIYELALNVGGVIVGADEIDDTIRQFGADRVKGLSPGVFRFEETRSFRAGSYGGFSLWRDTLSRAALGVPARAVWGRDALIKAESPFVPLIDFSDCNGVIGPACAAKLASDFRDQRERVRDFLDVDEDALLYQWGVDDFMDRYSNWTMAFELAARAGVVRFH